MKRTLPLLLAALILIFYGCKQDDIVLSDFTIKSGSSFGMCVGVCYQELTVNKLQIVLRTADRGRQGNDEPVLTNKRRISSEEWDEIKSLVNEEIIAGLPEVIGCPDCTDGGAEWVEITSPDLDKKITFDYGNPPAEIQELVYQLRETRKELSTEESK